jgi:hypothetical protein
MIHGMLEAGAADECAAHPVVLYPEDNGRIVPERYTQGYLHAQIAARVEGYLAVGEYGAPEARFFCAWEDALPRIEVAFVTWEQVVEAIDEAELRPLCANIGETTPLRELVYNGGRGKDRTCLTRNR